MKNIVSIMVAFLLIFAGLISCEKDKLPGGNVQVPDEETPNDSLDTTAENCGCGDNHSVTDILGTICYKITPHRDDTSTHHKFWITSGAGIYTHQIVCNKILPQEILKLKEDSDTITKLNISYSGNRKSTCKEMPSGYNNGSQVYYNIVLTKIEVQ